MVKEIRDFEENTGQNLYCISPSFLPVIFFADIITDKGWQILSLPSQCSSALASILGWGGRSVRGGMVERGIGGRRRGCKLYEDRVKESGNFGAFSLVPGVRELPRLPILSSC
jgi:hypothetical protein